MKLFARFVTAGALGTAVHYLVLLIAVKLVHLEPATGAMCGAACGGVVNYVLNRSFSFRSDVGHRTAAPRFFAMVVLGVLLNGAFVKLFTAVGINFLVAQLIATGVILVINFFIAKTWIFSKAP